MNGWTPSRIRNLTQPAPSATDVAIVEAMSVSAQGALNFRINIVTTVNAGQITYKLQQKLADTWVTLAGANATSAAVTASGVTTMKMSVQNSVDLPNLPLGSSLRVVATTNGSWDGTIDRVEHLQGL